MDILSYSLVLLSVLTHAYWNFLLKKSTDKDLFLALAKIAEVILFFIPFLILLFYKGFSIRHWYFIVIGAAFVLLNYIFLTKSYKTLDLSVAYPLTRSSGLFLPFLAYFFLGETINFTGGISIALITIGIFLIQIEKFRKPQWRDFINLFKNHGFLFALSAAFFVACYTVWDKAALWHFNAFIYFYSYTFFVALFYLFSLKRFSGKDIVNKWRKAHTAIIQVGLLNTFTYLLILYALSMSKASYVGVLRQLSIAAGGFLGWKLLKENMLLPKKIAITLMLMGGALIYFSG